MIRLALAALVSAALLINAADASARSQPRPTIVLVHGAFADASGFGAVTDRLQARGYAVFAPANPLRGLASDAAYVASAIAPIKGPIILVGHSYGGAVITEPALALPNVKALVYSDANALDEGESVLDISQRFPGKLGAALVPRPFAGGVDLYIDPASFHSVFAADVSARAAARMVTAQRPVTQGALSEKSGTPNWRSLPTWYLVGTADQAIPVAAQRFMAKRAKATTVEVRASHVSYLSHPDEVAALIGRAARGR
jgi:pimeloyl-ACP methyl ester carboxylesterase